MRPRHAFIVCKLLVAGIFVAVSVAKAQQTNMPVLPAVQKASYRDVFGESHAYLVQQPTKPAEHSQLLIYMHGAGGLEEQGMDPQWASRTFTRLRTLMNQWGWVYVCPRDEEFPGLLADLRKKYKPETIVLAGASAGGRVALTEASRAPKSYAGLILLCPAINGASDVSKLTMPAWIVSATGDEFITLNTRQLVGSLERAKKRHRYVEMPGGGHDTPVREVEWEKALWFLLETETPLTPK
ncbi:MAG: hypothetical protein WCS70_06445 [Verrucomicrobiota bacterium]